MGRKQRETVLFFSRLQRSLARFSQVVAAFFFPSRQEELLNKRPAGRQIVLQQQLQRKLEKSE